MTMTLTKPANLSWSRRSRRSRRSRPSRRSRQNQRSRRSRLGLGRLARLCPAILLWITLVALPSSVDAQPGPRGGPTVERGPASADRRETLKKKIRALRAYTLTEELSLDEQTAGKLFPMLARFDDDTDKLVVARGEVQKRLVDAGALKDAKAIDRIIDEALANQRGLRDLEDRRLIEFRKILGAAQVAKLMIVLPVLERRIQTQLRRALHGRGDPRGRVVDPFDDDDDAPMTHEPPEPARPATRGGSQPIPKPVPRVTPVPRNGGELCDPFDSRRPCR